MKKNNVIFGLITGFLLVTQIQAQDKTIEDIMREEQEAIRAIQQETMDYQDQVAEEMRLYEDQISREYEAYEADQRRQMEEMEREILSKWEEFRQDTREENVEYSADKNSRSSVNYKEGTVEVEVIADSKDPQAKQKAQAEIQKRLTDIAGSKNTGQQLKTSQGSEVTSANSQSFAKETVQKKKVKAVTYNARDGQERTKYSVKVTMVPNHIQIRAGDFKDEVSKQAKRFDINPAVAMAVMHTESFFNPKARSHIPAYGLMQLVPKSGARDAYIYIYKKDRLLKSDYLYIPPNNIELGCAYLAINRHRYFKGISDDEKANLCIIAAYNTGPGNVAKALTGSTNLKAAVAVANQHDTDWLRRKLLQDLPYNETKDYLKKVTERSALYQGWM